MEINITYIFYRLGERVKCDRDAVNSHLVAVCVRVFLEKRESHVLSFCEEFKKLTLADEKQDLVDNFLGKIHTEMESDSIWQGKYVVQMNNFENLFKFFFISKFVLKKQKVF